MSRATDKGMYGEHKGTVGARERMKDARHDPYEAKRKWPDPTRCSRCGAVFSTGRWTWTPKPHVQSETVCPACKRIEDDYPAGILEIGGDFFEDHLKEIVQMIGNVEEAEKADHPMERVMQIRRDDEKTIVTTTGIHLARRLGSALHDAYKGDLKLQYGEGEEHVRVFWRR